MKKGSPRKIRSDAKLGNLPEPERKQVLHWFAQCGWESCLVRVRTELHIETNRDSLYKAIKRWENEETNNHYLAIAKAQVEQEAEALGGMSLEQVEEAVDRHYLILASQRGNVKEYQDLRYMQIAARTARKNAQIAEAKLKQGEKKLAQKDADLQLAERRVRILEAKLEEIGKTASNPELSAEERAQRIAEIYGRA